MKTIFDLYKRSFTHLSREVWVISIAMFINRSGSMVLLFTSLYLTNELHFSIAQAGFALSCYGVGSILGSYAGGWLADRRNFYDIMLYSLLGSGLVLLNLLWAESYVAVSLIIFIYAFVADCFRPASSKAIAIFSTPENRTRSVSLVRLAINLGFAIGPAAGGFIALLLGYKWLFVIDALTSFAAALMLFIYLPRKEAAGNAATSSATEASVSAYRDKQFLFFVFFVALYGACFFQLFASVPQFYSKEWHYSEDVIGLLMGLNGLLVVLVEMPLVAWLETKPNNFAYISIGVLCIPLAFAFLFFGQGLIGMAIGYTVVITFSEIFAMPFMMNHTLSSGGKDRQGQYSALYSISFGISNTVAPMIGLGIADRYGFNTMFLLFMVWGLVAAGGFWWIKRSRT